MKVLIVDDSKAMRMIVRRALTQAGFANVEALEAGNGLQALEIIEQQSPDLVLSDWNMPEMKGIDLLTSLRSEAAAFPWASSRRKAAPRFIKRPWIRGRLLSSSNLSPLRRSNSC